MTGTDSLQNCDTPEEFWAAYENTIGEKVLAYSLACYLSGQEGFSPRLWGLLIATDTSFRFHHFPHEGWISALARLSGGGGKLPPEKTLCVPRSSLLSVTLIRPRNRFLRLISPTPPLFAVRYQLEGGSPQQLLFEADRDAEAVTSALSPPVVCI